MAAFIKNIAIEDSKGNQVNHEIALNHKIAIGEYIFDGTADINIPDTALGGDMELTMAEYQALSEEEKMNGLTYYITDVDGNMPVIVLTKEEYDALGDDKYSDGNIYLISDDVGDWTATGVVYDNKISGLEATNVGAALDELDKKIEDITGGTVVSDKANKDGNGNIITETYETKTDANQKLTDAKKYSDDKLVESKSYADTVGSNIKNDLLNGAGAAYDTLKELGELIDDNHDAIDAVNILTNKISSHYGIDSDNANILKSSQGTRIVNNDNTDFVGIQAKDFILPDGTNLSSISNNYFPSTGGTINGGLNVGGKVAFWSDNEGGNIDIYSPNGHTWQMDAHNDTTFRLYHHDGSNITGYHTWADGNYQSSGDVTTGLGISLNKLYQFSNVHGSNNLVSDLLHVDPNNPGADVNTRTVVATEDASTLVNSPVTSGAFYASREVQCIKSHAGGYKVNVILYENYPVSGRIWTSSFNPDNNSWDGWNSNDNPSTFVYQNWIGDVTAVDVNNIHNPINRNGRFTNDSANKPPNTYFGYREVFFVEPGFLYIIAHAFNTDSSSSIYMVGYNQNAGGWTGWKKISTNDDIDNLQNQIYRTNQRNGFFTGNIDDLRGNMDLCGGYWVSAANSSGTHPTDGYYHLIVPSEAPCNTQIAINYYTGEIRARMFVNDVWNSWTPQYLPLSGGTINGGLFIGDCIGMYSNGEGANIRLASADRLHHWEIDGCSNESLRIYHGTYNGHPNGEVEYDQGFYLAMDGNIISDKRGSVVFRGETVEISNFTWKLKNNSNAHILLNDSHNLKPYTTSNGADFDNSISLGTSNARFKQLFAGTANINTSDRNYKDNIKPLSDIHKELFMKLLPVSFTFKDGESGRTHIGFISQDVEAAMEELGMTSLDFAGFCKDKKISSRIVEKIITDEDGNETKIYEEESTPVLDKNGNSEYIYSLRYEEFIGIITHVLQDTVSRLDKIEKCLTQNGFYL